MYRILFLLLVIISCSKKEQSGEGSALSSSCDPHYEDHDDFEASLVPTLQRCKSCHIPGKGPASAPKFITDSDSAEALYFDIQEMIVKGNFEKLRDKPTGEVAHGGGKIFVDNASTWKTFLLELKSRLEDCGLYSEDSNPADVSGDELSCDYDLSNFQRVSDTLGTCIECHGGRGRGNLSLSAFAIEGQEEQIIASLANYLSFSDESLARLKQKPLGQLNHGGGAILEEDSSSYGEWLLFIDTLEVYNSCEEGQGSASSYSIQVQCSSNEPIAGGFKRLTAFEYSKTLAFVSSLSNFSSLTIKPLPKDPEDHGFATVASTYTITDSHLAVLIENAYEIADAMFLQSSALPDNCKQLNNANCVDDFIKSFVSFAFRREPTDEEFTRLLSAYSSISAQSTHQDGLKSVIVSVLIAPSFLYKSEMGSMVGEAERALSSREIADAISFLITGRPASGDLLEAAGQGLLSDEKWRLHYAKILMDSEEFKNQGIEFLTSLLGTKNLSEIGKDPIAFPQFTSSLKNSFIEEIKSFGEHLTSQEARLSDIYSANFSFVNDELSAFYGIDDLGTSTTPTKVFFPDDSQRTGIVTQGAFLTTMAHANSSSPVKRGAALVKQTLCKKFPLPPNDIPPITAVDATGKTGREIIEEHVSNQACASCHNILDPLGYALENFDGIGMYRILDNNKPVDASFEIILDGQRKSFANMKASASSVGSSKDFNYCMHEQTLRFAMGVSYSENEDMCYLADIWDDTGENLGLRDIILKIIGSEYFIKRKF